MDTNTPGLDTMSSPNPESKQHTTKIKYPIYLTIFSFGSFVLILILTIYLGNRLETLEEQLEFQPPEIRQSAYTDSFGIDIVDAQTVYVPVYSHIYSEGGQPYLLEATLSIRNTDPRHAITITSVRYYDTKGNLVKDYLNGRLRIGPLETTAFLVEKRDVRGGSGANFIVAWEADEPVYEPLIEAVMVGFSRNYSISFTSPGRPLLRRDQ